MWCDIMSYQKYILSEERLNKVLQWHREHWEEPEKEQEQGQR